MASGKASKTEPYENLDLSFDDLAEEDLKKAKKDPYGLSSVLDTSDPPYILGTLLVRVVAARDLHPAPQPLLGSLLQQSPARRAARGGGTANPYASVRFGSSTQRTSQVFDSLNPLWPRGETLYLDVLHPSWKKSDHNHQETASSSSRDDNPGNPPRKTASRPPSPNAPPPPQSLQQPRPDAPILTVAVFHASMANSAAKGGDIVKKPHKKGFGDSDDEFLGMLSVDVTPLLTGQQRTLDDWFPLQGTSGATSTLRLVCEYEASDGAPRVGDVVRFTGYCHPDDLYPAFATQTYTVDEVVDADRVVLARTSPEGWVSSFTVHRFMLLCDERYQQQQQQDESTPPNDLPHLVAARLSHSPALQTIRSSVQKVPEEGVAAVVQQAMKGGSFLVQRWLSGGIHTAVGDLAYATNWDGRFNPTTAESLSTDGPGEDEEEQVVQPNDDEDDSKPAAIVHDNDAIDDTPTTSRTEPLPNMPFCPITGEPMLDPVVAADGHTYERSAIARWLRTSDKSPLTGSILSHKKLVPNYMLVSSLTEASTRTAVGGLVEAESSSIGGGILEEVDEKDFEDLNEDQQDESEDNLFEEEIH